MSREDPQMKIRLPADLKESIEFSAKANGRTLNAEVVARLQTSFALSGEAPTLKAMQRMPDQEPWQAEIKAEYAKLSIQNRLMTLVTRQNQANFALMQTSALLAELRNNPERHAELELAQQMYREAVAERAAVDLARAALEKEMASITTGFLQN